MTARGTDEARAFFDKIARRYDRSYALAGEAARVRMEAVLALVGRSPSPKRILDLGVGTGRELSALQAGGHEVVGLEIAPAMIELCRRRAHPITVVEGDLWAPWPFEPRSFDAILALHGTLAHPPEPASLRALFANAARVLRPNGVFVAELPTPAWLERARSDGRIQSIASAGVSARFVDDVNGAAITIRLHPEEDWRAAAEGFRVAFEPIDDGEVRLVAHAVG